MSYVSNRRAIKDESGEVRTRVETVSIPDVEVIVLDSGRIAFRGAPDEYASSRLPAVTRMTKGIQGTPYQGPRFRDPWSPTRHQKSKA